MVADLPPPSPASGQFDDGEHRFALRVFFEDTDLTGMVYHANYLRFMERARSDMLRLLGIDQREAMANGTGNYAVTQMAIRYRAPARLDDDLLVLSRVADVGAARCVLDQTVWRAAHALADARVTVAFLDPAGRPRRQPADWIARFNQLRTKG